MAIYKNDIILIAGSGDFAFEAANYLVNKKKLNHIILLEENYKISNKYKEIVSYFDIKDIELASGLSVVGGGKHIREGIVIKPVEEQFCEELQGRKILKAKSVDFLMGNYE